MMSAPAGCFQIERKGMAKVTIRDVAKAAGVSTATVSNALNDAEVINPETKARVLRIAKELNYVPNMSGRMLKASKSKMIGFISSSLTGPYFSKLIEVMQEECEKYGYGLMLIYSQRSQIIRNYVFGGGLDGVFIYEGQERFDADEVAYMEEQGIKGILLDREYEGRTVGSIVFDSFYATYELTKYLIATGHRRIFFLKGPDDVEDSQNRERGYLTAMEEAGLAAGQDTILPGLFTEDVSYDQVIRWSKTGNPMPDAFVAGNDSSAMGCMNALKTLGIQVPEQVSVTGIDDIDLARYFAPAITTIHMPIEEQARLGVQHLLQLIGGNKPEQMSLKLKGSMVLRESVKEREVK